MRCSKDLYELLLGSVLLSAAGLHLVLGMFGIGWDVFGIGKWCESTQLGTPIHSSTMFWRARS